MAKSQQNSTITLLKLKYCKAEEVVRDARVTVKIMISRGRKKCPYRGSAKLYGHGMCDPRHVLHTWTNGTKVYLDLHRQRWKCRGWALYQGLCRHPLVGDIYRACGNGYIAMVEKFLIQAQQGTNKERGKEIMKLRGYLMDNCYGLRDYRLEVSGDGFRGLGAMEGNVDKLFADRMKKRGMSWTKKGVDVPKSQFYKQDGGAWL